MMDKLMNVLAILQALSIKSESPITRQPMSPSDLNVNAAIRFLCDKYHAGAFGDTNVDRSVVTKVSTDSIKLIHTITRNSNNKTMLTFDIDQDSMPVQDDGQVNLSQDVILLIDRSGSMQL